MGAAVAAAVVVGAIAFVAARGGNGGNPHAGMPGMDMSGSDTRVPEALPETKVSTASRMGSLIMPPGMVMTEGMSMEAMRGMAAVNPDEVDSVAAPDDRGDRLLEPVVRERIKEFLLTASVVRWYITRDVPVLAYAFNGQVPGPRLQLTQGDRVRITVSNQLPEATSVHWHGLVVPNNMDGPSELTQAPIPPGGHFTYEFTVEQHGTFFYHSHTAADRQQALGLSGALVVTPKEQVLPAANRDVVVQLQEWTVRDGFTFPAMPMEGLMPNFFTLNGKAWPATETIKAKVGEEIRIRFIGAGSFAHPMHVHGGPFAITATDGQPVPAESQIAKDTVNVSPGERYDIVWGARQPGKWLLHCHVNHHLTNDGTEERGAGGLTMVIDVAP